VASVGLILNNEQQQTVFDPHIEAIYVFCVDLRTNSDYFPTQH